MRATGILHLFTDVMFLFLLFFLVCGSGIGDPIIIANYTTPALESSGVIFTFIGNETVQNLNQTYLQQGLVVSDLPENQGYDLPGIPSGNISAGPVTVMPVTQLGIDPAVMISPGEVNPVPDTEDSVLSESSGDTSPVSFETVSTFPVSPVATPQTFGDNVTVSPAISPGTPPLSFGTSPSYPSNEEVPSQLSGNNVTVSSAISPDTPLLSFGTSPSYPSNEEVTSQIFGDNVTVSSAISGGTPPLSFGTSPSYPSYEEVPSQLSGENVTVPGEMSEGNTILSIGASPTFSSPEVAPQVFSDTVTASSELSSDATIQSIGASPTFSSPEVAPQVFSDTVTASSELSSDATIQSIGTSPTFTSPEVTPQVSGDTVAVSAEMPEETSLFTSKTLTTLPDNPQIVNQIPDDTMTSTPETEDTPFLPSGTPSAFPVSAGIEYGEQNPAIPVSASGTESGILSLYPENSGNVSSEAELSIVSTNGIQAPVSGTEPDDLFAAAESETESKEPVTGSALVQQPSTPGISGASDKSGNTAVVQASEDNSEEKSGNIAVEYAEGEVIVCFAGDGSKPAGEAVYSAAHEKIGAEMVESLAVFGEPEIQLVSLPDGMEVTDAVAYYESDPNVLYAEPNYVVTACAIPDDPDYDQLWGMKAVSAPEAWDLTTGSSDVIVAVVDGGVDYTHPDLAENMWVNANEIPDNGIDDDNNGFIDDYRGWDFYNENPNPMDKDGHGTHCAGTIGAVGNNGIGVAGYNWQVRIMPLKFLGSPSGSGYTFDATQAIKYGSMMGAKVMNHSWGGGDYSQALHDALAASPAVMSIGAGNDNYNLDRIPGYPESYDCENIIVVAAIDSNGDLAQFSNYGKNTVDVAAPGVAILSTVLNSSYDYYKGTSMAAPQVSGLAALLCAADPDASSLDVIRTIKDHTTASAQVADKVETGGVINAYASVNAVWQNPLHAEASVEPLTGKAPLNVTCIGSASGSITSWVWDFGDSTTPGVGQIVTHTYTNANYNPVTLQVSDGTNTDAVTKLVTVYPDAEFTANVTTGEIPLTVAFTSQSTGLEPDKIYWKFGDGVAVQNTNSPVHTYTKAGTYTVTLIVERRGLSDQEIKTGYIVATDPSSPITAGFTADPSSGPAPLQVAFTDRSTGPVTSWNWNFGDQTQSTEQNPSHRYDCPGEYTVTLTVSGGGGEDSATGSILVTSESDFLISLDPGWNLISTPKKLAPGSDSAAIFANVDTAGHSILTYDPVSPDWIVLSENSLIEPLYGYWIYAQTAIDIPLTFDQDPVQVPPSRDLLAGWNIIGFANLNPATARDTMLSVQDAWTYVIGYNSGQQRYEETIINGGTGEFSDTHLMYPSEGYWTFMNQSGTLAGIGV